MNITSNEQLSKDVARIAKTAAKLNYEFGSRDYRQGKIAWIDRLDNRAECLGAIVGALDGENSLSFRRIIESVPACRGRSEILRMLDEWGVTLPFDEDKWSREMNAGCDAYLAEHPELADQAKADLAAEGF